MNFSVRWSLIKNLFSRQYIDLHDDATSLSPSRQRKGEAGIWQRRFWEHWIRDEVDLYRHINYIHYNPIKHGLVEQIEHWPWSTYHRYVREGFYGRGIMEEAAESDPTGFGE